MAIGGVQINNLNLMQGPLNEVERYFLYIGAGTKNQGKVLTVDNGTDFDELLGTEDSTLKTQLIAARQNAGQNWGAVVYVLATGEDWDKAVDICMPQVTVETIVVTEAISAKTDLEAMHAKAQDIMGEYQRPLFFIAASRKIDTDSEDWSTYVTEQKKLTDGIAGNQVMVVPTLWGHDQGTLAGRLCNRAVTVADSPMRVATGPLIGEWGEKPVDMDDREIDMSILRELDSARFSVPQWYPDYDGMYWADGNMLDVEDGDYQTVENLRVVQKVMRRIRPLAIARIADRKLNSTPASEASNKTYFMRPLFEMSHSTEVLGTVFPGEVQPPEDEDITITWPTRDAVELFVVVRPYNSAKSITANIALDLV
ncbi:hypothetical protein GZ77_03870 [Endozoicomonas montiporae]|uniref:Phage tail protein n=2 Tax=Endozoicomonas montiporae TaxID=1027273 RepID=A0A081NB91_9GAMM|nr:DUF2586 domain-containing protein [Endozoicomonas montiporae]AMO56560.1 hypothetical protein EZMO1_2476 [Endozoicomonas montiporae CL-33]KEQ15714.1 hypothetical protein GZ77_03870 [Endozoicomonas montiporae]